jgi:hypothetical protein
MARLKASKYRERYKGAFSRIAEAEYSVASLSALRYLGGNEATIARSTGK